MKETTELKLKMEWKTLVKGENIYVLNKNRHEEKKDDTEISRMPETDRRQTFISLLQQNTNTMYSEYQLKISLFHHWYVLLTG